MQKGFTLIELLVVVFIISILAAIALPMYQKSVWKSRATHLQQSVRDLAHAQERHRLMTGSDYASKFSDLDITFDGFTTTSGTSVLTFGVAGADSVKSNNFMELVINRGTAGTPFLLSTGGFTAGPYRSAGFSYNHLEGSGVPARQLMCIEIVSGVSPAGAFCQKVMGITSAPVTQWNVRYYL